MIIQRPFLVPFVLSPLGKLRPRPVLYTGHIEQDGEITDGGTRLGPPGAMRIARRRDDSTQAWV
jgi:hypothetical protein